MKKRYFACQSAHGGLTSYGFSNDIDVFVFESKSDRDKFVQESKNLSCKAIRKSQVTSKASNYNLRTHQRYKPKPFSGEFWGIDNSWLPEFAEKYNVIGTVIVCSYGDNCEKIYK
jgi:hypothetical protein